MTLRIAPQPPPKNKIKPSEPCGQKAAFFLPICGVGLMTAHNAGSAMASTVLSLKLLLAKTGKLNCGPALNAIFTAEAGSATMFTPSVKGMEMLNWLYFNTSGHALERSFTTKR